MTTTDIPDLAERHCRRFLDQAEFIAEATARFGADPLDWAYVCPSCGETATVREWPKGQRGTRAGIECIGTLGNAADEPRGCLWIANDPTAAGPWFVRLPDGNVAPCFALAPAPSHAPQDAPQDSAAPELRESAAAAPDAAVGPGIGNDAAAVRAPWQPMDTAPRDGTEIIGLFGDEEWEIRWAEERRCMLAESYRGTPGIGLFDAGWEQAVEGLAVTDEPDAWRPVETAAVPLPSEPFLTSDDASEATA